MKTEEMLIEIVSYDYKSEGFPYIILDYSPYFKVWNIIWRNPRQFLNEQQTESATPAEACKKALDFIKSNPDLFKKKH